MKYIDADKLIAEIERRLKSLHEWKTGWARRLPLLRNETYYKNFGKMSAYDAILNIITSLQQEQPEVDLVKALSCFTGYYAHENSGEYPSAIDIARYFAEWGAIHLNARKEE